MNFDFGMISLNVRGIRDFKKSKKMFHWISKHGGDTGISFIQETHSSIDIEYQWKQRFKSDILFSHGTKQSRGVAILFGPKLEYKIIEQWIDNAGRYIIVNCIIQGNHCLLINSYFPNIEKVQITLKKNLFQKLENIGDFNFVTNSELETAGGNPQLKTSTIEQFLSIEEEMDLCDIWRIRNPDVKRFTWRRYAQGRASIKQEIIHRRLDYFLVSDHMQSLVQKTDIIPAPSTDHSALILQFRSLPKNQRGPSFWKINNSLINDPQYVELIKIIISDRKKG